MQEEKCKECEMQWSCRYLKHRFGVDECILGKEIIINNLHQEQLKERENMLKGWKRVEHK